MGRGWLFHPYEGQKPRNLLEILEYFKNEYHVLKLSHLNWSLLLDSPEEGEIRGPKKPKIPRGSPPPEEEWAPCIRMLVSESNSLTKGTLFLVTQDGASVGR